MKVRRRISHLYSRIKNFVGTMSKVLAGLIFIATPLYAASQEEANVNDTFTLWQLQSVDPNQQMNSYIIETALTNRVMVIDGGTPADAVSLRKIIKEKFNNHVDMWFVTHPHIDHVGALKEILLDNQDMVVDGIYGSLIPSDYTAQLVPYALSVDEQTVIEEFEKLVEGKLIELTLGEVLLLDNLTIKILNVKNPELLTSGNLINNSSVVLKVYDEYKSVLFLGDLGIEGGEKVLKGEYVNELKSDYVQMAHHGSHGVTEEFYLQVYPDYCLWPTPGWLYCGSYPTYTSAVVRGWIEKMSVSKKYHIKNYLMFEGEHRIKQKEPLKKMSA